MAFNRKFALAALSAIFLAAPAVAADQSSIPSAVAATTDLGNGASAITYWVDAADGRHVTTTLDLVVHDPAGRGEDHHAVARVSAVLLPGQSQVISVPSFDGGASQALQVSRSGDRIELTRIATAGPAQHIADRN